MNMSHDCIHCEDPCDCGEENQDNCIWCDDCNYSIDESERLFTDYEDDADDEESWW